MLSLQSCISILCSNSIKCLHNSELYTRTRLSLFFHDQFNMKLRGSLLVIVCCLVVEFCNINQKEYMLYGSLLPSRLSLFAEVGLLFLLYPLVGHLTDVYLTRYRSLKWSFGFIMFLSYIIITYVGIFIVVLRVWKFEITHRGQINIFIILICIIYRIGLALFQANAIQFGLDQLLEAPTPKLISFIHWYYWAQNVGSLALFYVFSSIGLILDEVDVVTNGTINKPLNGNVSIEAFVLLLAMSVAVTAVFIKFGTTKKHFYIEKAGLNPFKNIYKVFKYSWKHKVPEHRSAFTYWEEDIPRRIDLGKNKYGGPFTNEEVEDTKTFLRILPLLLCLFGYHLAGDGYSAPQQLQRTSCPSLPVLILIVYNPLHMSTLVSVVGIPLYRLVIMKVVPRLKYVRMLTKM